MLISAFQSAVQKWMRSTFNQHIELNILERQDRFLEECLELLQSRDYPKDRVPMLLEYVYSRPKGEEAQELGGAIFTLAAYANAAYLSLEVCAVTELIRGWEKQEVIREKQKSKPKDSPLPQSIDNIPTREVYKMRLQEMIHTAFLNTSDSGNTFSDGFHQGLVRAIEELDKV